MTNNTQPPESGASDAVPADLTNGHAEQDKPEDTPPGQLTTNPDHADYWRANIRLMLALLAIWFVVSFGFGILLVDWLNQFRLFGFKLGFWWAQQGSIYVFVVLIFVYAARMKTLDRKFGVSDDD